MKKPVGFPWSPPKWLIVTLALLLSGLIGVANRATGHDLSLTAFYLIPITWACWTAGRGAGLLLAAVSALAWLLADTGTGYAYPYGTIIFWNALTLLVLFTGGVFLLAALQAAHRRLEETVQLRTAALQQELAENKRLAQAKVQAERLAAVGTMAAQMAHEVRNPLGSITLNLDLVDKEIVRHAKGSGQAEDEGRQLVQEMRYEVHRIQHVIDDYLQFARPREPQRQLLAVNAFLEQKLAFMLSVFERAKVKLRTEFDPALITVRADSDQIWQAVLNLIQNSLEAMPDGGELIISTWCEGNQAIMRVADSGAGMNAESLAQIFQPFFTTKSRGTGLGLALVQQTVSQHDGRVECDSLEGRGSAFTIFLPVVEKT